MNIGCVLLAAGAGRRFGGGKLLHEIEGEPMISYAFRLLATIPFAVRVCVTREEDGAIPGLARNRGFIVAVNPDPDRGVGTSVSIGAKTALTLEPELDGILFAVSDQPYLLQESVERLTKAFSGQPERIVSLSKNGVRGNPAIFPKSLFGELAVLGEDVGGGAVIRRHPQMLRLVEASSARELEDVDTRETQA